MSAKFVYNLSDDNQDLQKQIGCMNGIFQLFDRHHFLGGGRRHIGQHHKSRPPDQNGNKEMEPKHASQNTTEKDDKTIIREKHRNSPESSRTSFSSSSCSSSFSSLESAKATQWEPPSLSQTVTQESHQRNSPVYCSNATSLSTWQSPDLRHAVKHSIFRETRSISVKTSTKGEAGGLTLKYIDSPRPLQHQKYVEPKYSGLKESIQVSQKSRETPCKSSERAESSFNSSLKDMQRFSLDGRESRDTFKSTMKLKELPRLSLDSQAGSTRGNKTEVTRSYPPQDTEIGNFNDFVSRQEPGTSRRASSVVAKLMGLEAPSEPTSNDGNQVAQFRGYHNMETGPMQSSRTTNQNRQTQKASSPRCLSKEPSSPRLKSTDSAKKKFSKTKSSTESAPWSRPLEESSSPPVFASEATIRKDQNSSISVHGEIEKCLAHLESRESGKDIRALKQILEAMQKTRKTFEIRNDVSEFASHTSGNKSHDLSSDLANLKSPQSSTNRNSSMKEISSSESFKSPIIIMKPAKLIGKVRYPASSINQNDDLGLYQLETADSEGGKNKSNDKVTSRDLTHKTNSPRMSSRLPTHTLDKSPQPTAAILTPTSKELVSITSERRDSTKNSRTTNPRHQRKMLELEKHSQPLTPSIDLNRVRRRTCRQFKQPGSHRRQSISKPSNLLMMEGQSSNTNEERSSSYLVGVISQQSESNVSTASPFDIEVISTNGSEKILSPLSQPTYATQKMTRLTKDMPTADPVAAHLEQPSPVSVLDATFYDDELPSPIKKISTSFKDEIISEDVDWNFIATHHSPSSNSSSFIDSKKVENINHLYQQLEQMLSANESITNGLRTFNNSPSLEQEYISSKTWHAPRTLAHKEPRGLKLWEELCAEVDRPKSSYSTRSLDTDDDGLTRILPEDLMQQTLHWRSDNEIPWLVLDVERFIFKTLINEVIIGEAMSLQRQSARHCRQMFDM